jgi:endonuclease/exonuclease/phosphatase family metal-dependent hydrolase
MAKTEAVTNNYIYLFAIRVLKVVDVKHKDEEPHLEAMLEDPQTNDLGIVPDNLPEQSKLSRRRFLKIAGIAAAIGATYSFGRLNGYENRIWTPGRHCKLDKDTLTVLTLNCANGLRDSLDGITAVFPRDTTDTMKDIAALIRHYDPDVVFLQELSINRKINQPQFLMDNTSLIYGVFEPMFNNNFILLGTTEGNMILSRYRLHGMERSYDWQQRTGLRWLLDALIFGATGSKDVMYASLRHERSGKMIGLANYHYPAAVTEARESACREAGKGLQDYAEKHGCPVIIRSGDSNTDPTHPEHAGEMSTAYLFYSIAAVGGQLVEQPGVSLANSVIPHYTRTFESREPSKAYDSHQLFLPGGYRNSCGFEHAEVLPEQVSDHRGVIAVVRLL